MDTPTPSITLDDLIAALEQAQHGEQGDEVGLSTDELCALTGWTDKKVREALRELATAGRLRVRKRRQRNLAGDWTRAPVYWVAAEVATTVNDGQGASKPAGHFVESS